MSLHILAGQPAPRDILVNIPRLMSAYYTHQPDVTVSTQTVAFGTSGHRGASPKSSFNEAHVLAICQALWEYRQHRFLSLRSSTLIKGFTSVAVKRCKSSTGAHVY